MEYVLWWGVENIVQEYTCSLAERWPKAYWKMNFLHLSGSYFVYEDVLGIDERGNMIRGIYWVEEDDKYLLSLLKRDGIYNVLSEYCIILDSWEHCKHWSFFSIIWFCFWICNLMLHSLLFSKATDISCSCLIFKYLFHYPILCKWRMYIHCNLNIWNLFLKEKSDGCYIR